MIRNVTEPVRAGPQPSAIGLWPLMLLCVVASHLCVTAAAAPGVSKKPPPNRPPEIAAIYFPGFHQDDHYDSWLGPGWNEWKLLQEARPRFPGHRLLQSDWGPFDEADPVDRKSTRLN